MKMQFSSNLFCVLIIFSSLSVPHDVISLDRNHPPGSPSVLWGYDKEYKVDSRLSYRTVLISNPKYKTKYEGVWFVWHHKDGKREWDEWLFEPDCYMADVMYFLDSKIGWIITPCGQMFKTVNGGREWVLSASGEWIGWNNSFYAISEQILFLTNANEYATNSYINVLISLDAGKDWRALTRDEILGTFGLSTEEFNKLDWPLAKTIRRGLTEIPAKKVGFNTRLPGDPTNLVPGSFSWDRNEWRRKHPGLPDPPPDKRNLPPDQYPGPGTPSPKAVPPAPAKSPEAATPAR